MDCEGQPWENHKQKQQKVFKEGWIDFKILQTQEGSLRTF